MAASKGNSTGYARLKWGARFGIALIVFVVVVPVFSYHDVHRERTLSADTGTRFPMRVCSGGDTCGVLWSNDLDRLGLALLVRDRLRRLIGRWNRDHLDFAKDAPLFASLARLDDAASASCGPMSFALEHALAAHGIPARLVAFFDLADEGKILNGYSALEVELENGSWVLIDGHAGLVWQDVRGELGSATQVGCQFVCYATNSGQCRIFPSFQGKQFAHVSGLETYAMRLMDLDAEIHPGLISAVARGRPITARNECVIDTLEIFGEPGSPVAEDLMALLGASGRLHDAVRETHIHWAGWGVRIRSRRTTPVIGVSAPSKPCMALEASSVRFSRDL